MEDFDFIDEEVDEIDVICNNEIFPTVTQNFPFLENDIDAMTDYELFCKGFEYLDDKKADKSEIPDLSDYVKKDTTDLENYTLTSDLSEVATTGDYDDLINKPTIPDVSNFITKDVDDLTYYTKTSDLSTVATTGDYDDLIDKPTIPDVSNFITKDVNDLTYYTKTSDLSTVATTGDYDDLINKPTIPDVSNFITNTDYASSSIGGVVKVDSSNYGSNITSGYLCAGQTSYTNYLNKSNNFIIGKGTLENVITGKNLQSIESGSNTNGYYVKFGDGTLIQWNRITVNDQAISSQYGTTVLYYGTRSITFPIQFVGDFTGTCSYFHWGTGGSYGAVMSQLPDGTGMNLVGYDFYPRATGTDTNIAWMAVGRWK